MHPIFQILVVITYLIAVYSFGYLLGLHLPRNLALLTGGVVGGISGAILFAVTF